MENWAKLASLFRYVSLSTGVPPRDHHVVNTSSHALKPIWFYRENTCPIYHAERHLETASPQGSSIYSYFLQIPMTQN